MQFLSTPLNRILTVLAFCLVLAGLLGAVRPLLAQEDAAYLPVVVGPPLGNMTPTPTPVPTDMVPIPAGSFQMGAVRKMIPTARVTNSRCTP